MGLRKALTVFGLLALISLIHILVTSQPGMAKKIGDEQIASTQTATEDGDVRFIDFAIEKTTE